jgi:predicted RNase H-like nuclease (RuvC/YqgF family)
MKKITMSLFLFFISLTSFAFAQDSVQEKIGGVLGEGVNKSKYDGEYGDQKDGVFILSKKDLLKAINSYYKIYDTTFNLEEFSDEIDLEKKELNKRIEELKQQESDLRLRARNIDQTSAEEVNSFNKRLEELENDFEDLYEVEKSLREQIEDYNSKVSDMQKNIRIFQNDFIGKQYYLEDYIDIKAMPDMADKIVAYEMGQFLASQEENDD